MTVEVTFIFSSSLSAEEKEKLMTVFKEKIKEELGEEVEFQKPKTFLPPEGVIVVLSEELMRRIVAKKFGETAASQSPDLIALIVRTIVGDKAIEIARGWGASAHFETKLDTHLETREA
jgi:hypothetical protein